MTIGPTCDHCGANLTSGYLEDSDPGGPPVRVCPNCNPDHPFSVNIRESAAQRDPRYVDKISIEIYGKDLPALEVWDAVRKFVHETFDAEWLIDLRTDAEQI